MPILAGDLESQLPALAPRAVAWAQKMEVDSLRNGAPLSPAVLRLARELGVRDVARVRLVVVDRVPMPEERMLRAAAFLSKHVVDLARVGYEASPFEVDARAHERTSLPDPGA